MTIRHIKIFKTICDNEYNFTKAARTLYMSQPAVSLAVKELEQYYGTPLFDRVGTKLAITDAGIRLLNYCTEISGLFDNMEKDLKDWDSLGVINVGASFTPGAKLLPQCIKIFKEKYPKVTIKSIVAPYYELESKILQSELDFAIIEGRVRNSSVEAHPFTDDKLVLVCPSDMGYSDGDTIPQDEFCRLNLLVRESGSSTRDLFDRVCESAGLNIEPVLESHCNTALINSVINGLGVAVMPVHIAADFAKAYNLITVNVEGLDMRKHLSIMLHKNKRLSKGAKTFIEICNDIANK